MSLLEDKRMVLNESILEGIVSSVWKTMLDTDIVQVSDGNIFKTESVSSLVAISGAWNGRVFLEMSREYAQKITAGFFDKNKEEVINDEILDTAGEMVNIIGGQVKSAISGTSQLSIPTRCLGTVNALLLGDKEKIVLIFATSEGEPIKVGLSED